MIAEKQCCSEEIPGSTVFLLYAACHEAGCLKSWASLRTMSLTYMGRPA